ncbi:MAG: thioredoxin domain-containing protein, partial [Bryobacterales bacterium]|nr:thioredoxin domain-containing protein [Bryobacterales bacterium]
MRKPFRPVAFALALSVIPAFAEDTPLATVNGEPIHQSDLDVNAQWRKLDQQIHALRSQALGSAIATKLLESEAERRGMAPQEFVAAEIEPKIGSPTNKEVSEFYNQQREKIGKPLREVRDEIVRILRQQKAATHLNDLVAVLRADAQIEILLAPPRLPVELAEARQRGPEDAPVTIVEFSDFQCPFCRKVQPVLSELREEYQDRIRWVFKDLPLSDIHPEAARAAQAARCAGEQEKFWEYHAELFEQELFTDATYTQVAEATEVDPEPLMECLNSGKFQMQVAAEVGEARNLGIEGTPAILINGILISGAREIENYRSVIEQELAKAAETDESSELPESV